MHYLAPVVALAAAAVNLTSGFVHYPHHSIGLADRRGPCYPAEMTSGLPFKPVDPNVIHHLVERRGFVTVPLDHGVVGGPTIDIFYRLIPAHGTHVDDTSKPVVVVINGGPGIPASFYRALDFDYASDAVYKGLDRFKHLLATHHVLIADQRGTDGNSAPLDMDDSSLDPNLIARLFSADSHALDYLAVVDQVIPERQPWYVIAQSYGGLPGVHLVAQRTRRRPVGIVFSSSALPFEDPLASMRARRQEQLRLNLHLVTIVPEIAARLDHVRAHLTSLQLDPRLVHGLFVLLGKDVPGVWEPEVVRRLDKIGRQARAEVLADVEAGLELPSLLNYILSSSNFSPGETDRTLAATCSREIPFEPWMIDEHVMLMTTGQDGTWREAMVDGIDRAPPAGTPMPTLADLRLAIGESQVLFTAADNDAFVPGDMYRDHVDMFLVPGHTEVRTLPGGHHAIFLEKGYEAFIAWERAIGSN